jgi:DNA (cytosine-5)-methyltransferase 1
MNGVDDRKAMLAHDHLRLLDLFSGIGGFHLGLERAGHKIGWSGFCEIDKYASAVYKRRFPDAQELGDVRSVQGKELPKIDIITFGSPCQDFSIAGKRAGMGGPRSSLISEAIRLIDECRPGVFIWENVKGTFSSNNRQDFAAILQAFANIGGYRLEWQLLNTRWVLPQNRERIFLVGYTGGGSGREIFPIGEDGELYKKRNARTKSKVDAELCSSITTREGGRKENNFVIVDKKLSTKNNQDYAACLSGGAHSGGNHSDMDLLYKVHNTQTRNPKNTQAVEIIEDFYPGRIRTFQESPTLRSDRSGLKVSNNTQIRRLTPKECERLQGFPDDWTSEGIINGEVVKMSDTQRYKQCGNAVTVDIVSLVASHIPRGQQ